MWNSIDMIQTPVEPRIAVVIPSYKVTRHVLDVISRIGPECNRIYVVDDACPEGSGRYVEENCTDSRVRVIFHEKNKGVGGAVITGYRAAIEEDQDIVVKIDGDGQMDPALLPDFVEPIVSGEADYTKGNRFYDLEEIHGMPKVRLFGNAMLSFMAKFSSGYWDLFDPTNGYTAVHVNVLRRLPLHKLSERYFFETDILFRLNIVRAVVVDVPMDASYGDEVSNLKVSKIIGEFMAKHMRNAFKRIAYNYYLRDMSLASLELPMGISLLLFSIFFGGSHWISSAHHNVSSPVGTIMIATVSLLMGVQFLLAFVGHDVAQVPRRVIHRQTRFSKSRKLRNGEKK
ncbi:glycosyltransferase family 2 protein [Achromobacter spanius]|uniref:glycosyltransferase family 2 protein n=1 Tax=Achromobacter spanius TaxID=217203 RepID=UPI0032082AEA